MVKLDHNKKYRMTYKVIHEVRRYIVKDDNVTYSVRHTVGKGTWDVFVMISTPHPTRKVARPITPSEALLAKLVNTICRV